MDELASHHRTSIQKRSVVVDGHRTSVSLEADFWRVLSCMAEERRISMNALVTEIDHQRGAATDGPGLSSALRLSALNWALGRSAVLKPDHSPT